MHLISRFPKRISFLGLSALYFALLPAFAEEGMPARDLPKELGVLERFLGTWDHEVNLKHPDGGRDSNQKTVSTRTWSSGGSFLRIEDVNWAKPQFDEFQMLLTYDVLQKKYLGVIMDGPDVSTVTATWDEEAKAMTFDARGEGGNLKYTVTFLNENEATGKGNFTKDGKVMAEITWKQTKRKE